MQRKEAYNGWPGRLAGFSDGCSQEGRGKRAMFFEQIIHELDFVYFLDCVEFPGVNEVIGKTRELVSVVLLKL